MSLLLSAAPITWPTERKPSPQHCGTLRGKSSQANSIAGRPSPNGIKIDTWEPPAQDTNKNRCLRKGREASQPTGLEPPAPAPNGTSGNLDPMRQPTTGQRKRDCQKPNKTKEIMRSAFPDHVKHLPWHPTDIAGAEFRSRPSLRELVIEPKNAIIAERCFICTASIFRFRASPWDLITYDYARRVLRYRGSWLNGGNGSHR